MTSQIEAASRALYEAGRRGEVAAPLIPALAACPDCRVTRMITSPAPLGACPDCGSGPEAVPPRRAAAAAPPAPEY